MVVTLASSVRLLFSPSTARSLGREARCYLWVVLFTLLALCGSAHAEVSERAEDNEEAIRAYGKLLKAGHNPEQVGNNLAGLLSDNRTDPADFERAYELALGLDHDRNPYFRDTLGWASYRLGRYADAVKLLEATIAESPSVAVLHYHLGMSYLARGNRALAKQVLATALALCGRTPLCGGASSKGSPHADYRYPGRGMEVCTNTIMH